VGYLSHQKLKEVLGMWRELLVVKEKPRAFKPHTTYHNLSFSNSSTSIIKSSGKRIEKFLNLLYEINPELIRKFVEMVEIDDDEPIRWAYVYVSEELAKCITKASWERITDLISATDIITAKLDYDLSCVKRLAEKLEQKA
jgi:hypothetical protein